MKFHEQEIPGVFVIEPEPVCDARGKFRRAFCSEEFARAGIVFAIRQTNFSENLRRHTLRGIHFRTAAHPECKVLTCVRGAVFNAVVDLRRGSPAFGKWVSLELSQENGFALYLPHGCGNAFLTMRDDSAVHYYHSSIYQPGADTGVRYDDPVLGIKWPAAPEVVSEKDLALPAFDPATSGV